MAQEIKQDTNNSKRIMRAPEVRKILGGISHTTLWQYVKNKEGFPQPVRFGANSIGWIESEIDAYIDACASARKGA